MYTLPVYIYKVVPKIELEGIYPDQMNLFSKMDFFNIENFQDYMESEGIHPVAQPFFVWDMILIKATLCLMLEGVEILGSIPPPVENFAWMFIFIMPLFLSVLMSDEYMEELLQDLERSLDSLL